MTPMMTKTFASAALALGLVGAAVAQEVPEEIGTAVSAAESVGIIETLTSGGEVTVFVPSNEALAAVPQDELGPVLADTDLLSSVIQGYAVEGTITAADATALLEENDGSAEVDSLAGTPIGLTLDGDAITVSGAGELTGTVVTPDIQFGNITIHVIDGAFLPGATE